MSHLTSLAKPYALAAFRYAQRSQQLASWATFLAIASYLAQHEQIVELLKRPNLSSHDLYNLFDSIIKQTLAKQKDMILASYQNFLLLLAQQKRLATLPAIQHLFKLYLAAWQKQQTAYITTAIPLNKAYQKQLTDKLSTQLQQTITLQYEVDPAILGGIIIQLGDRVIDNSIRNRLTRLEAFLR